MVDCPVDGCEYSNENEGSVLAHASSSKGDHKGVGYQKARQMLDISGENTDSGSDSSGSEPDSSPTAPEFPEADDGDGGDGAGSMEGATCPQCGGAVSVFAEPERFATTVDGTEGYATADVGDLYCGSCEIVVDSDTGEVWE